jgi:hypothetical protein
VPFWEEVLDLTLNSLAHLRDDQFNEGMSAIVDRIRSRREAERRARAIARVMRSAPSSALRRELLEITNRSV